MSEEIKPNEAVQAQLDAIKEEHTPAVASTAMSEDPLEMASTLMYLYTPKFDAAVNQLSSNALRRVLKKLVSYPLNEKAFKPTSQLESDVFNIGDRLLEAKYLMIYDQYAKLVEADMLKEQEAEKKDMANENKGENENG